MVLYVLEPMALKSSPCACSTNIQSLQRTTELERLDVWRIDLDLSGAAEGRATSTFPSLVTSRAAALSANSTSHSRAGRWIATLASH
jgi:hypothetical protein